MTSITRLIMLRNLQYNPSTSKDKHIIYIDKNNKSWIEIEHLPEIMKKYSTDNFNLLFDLRPKDKSKIIMRDIEISAHRRYESYLNTPKLTSLDVRKSLSYMFSDLSNKQEKSLPIQFQPYLDYMNTTNGVTTNKYNQVVTNWYEDGNDYLPFHSDWSEGLQQNSKITMITVTDDNENCRILNVKLSKKIVCMII